MLTGQYGMENILFEMIEDSPAKYEIQLAEKLYYKNLKEGKL